MFDFVLIKNWKPSFCRFALSVSKLKRLINITFSCIHKVFLGFEPGTRDIYGVSMGREDDEEFSGPGVPNEL